MESEENFGHITKDTQLANRHMKRYYFTLIRKAKIKNNIELSGILGGSIKWYNYFGKLFGSFVKHNQDPQVPLKGAYLTEMKAYIHKNTYMRMFILALFIIIPIWYNNSHFTINYLYPLPPNFVC